MQYIRTFVFTAIVLLLAGCRINEKSDTIEWVDTGREVNENYADVIWFTGTLFDDATYEAGDEYRIRQTDKEKEIYIGPTLWARDNLFPDSLNFFAPYYHQFTFSSLTLPEECFDSLCEVVYDEAYEAFHYYMENMNNGRPYILAGMSQGGMVVNGILKRMTDEEYSKMVATYSLGYGISAEDMTCSHIRPAEGATDKGVVISVNSVKSPDGIWPLVYNNAKAVINPVSWTTDTVAATFVARGDTVTVSVDDSLNVLMVKGWTHHTPMNNMKGPWVEDNLHLEDLIMYAPLVQRNALDRVYKEENNK